ncbi:MAG: MATE family efflux transporter, partial [Traorella sp.]
LFLLGHVLLRIYSSSEDVIQAGIIRLGIVSRTYALCGIMDVMVGSLRGLGYSIFPMIVSLLGACVFRLVWISTLFPLYPTVDMVYVSYPLSWIITIIAHVLTFVYVMHKINKQHAA